jgi:hypothetical protein
VTYEKAACNVLWTTHFRKLSHNENWKGLLVICLAARDGLVVQITNLKPGRVAPGL